MQVGAAKRAMRLQEACGDHFSIAEQDGTVCVALADGLGHGPQAALASQLACSYVAQNATTPLLDLMRQLHRELASTRGAAVTLLRVSRDGVLEHTAVGNVEVRSFGPSRVHPIARPGIVGKRMRKVVETRYQLVCGDLIVAYTDGIKSRFELEAYVGLDAQVVADKLVTDWSREHDDAACAVIAF